MHRVSPKLLLQAILALLRRPPVVRRVDPRRAASHSSTFRRAAIATALPVTREAKVAPALMAKKRRADSAEWPETQPWCHQ